MKYSTNNVQISMTMHLAEYLREKGYDVRWHTDKSVDAQTAGLPAAKDTVTLVPDFPEDPAFVVRKQGLNGDTASPEEVVVPAMTLMVLDTPIPVAILGLGHKEREWERSLRIDGIATDDFQQRELADLLHDWLLAEQNKAFTISDHDGDPASPVVLEDPVYVEFAHVARKTLPQEVEAVRPYFYATVTLSYIE